MYYDIESTKNKIIVNYNFENTCIPYFDQNKFFDKEADRWTNVK